MSQNVVVYRMDTDPIRQVTKLAECIQLKSHVISVYIN